MNPELLGPFQLSLDEHCFPLGGDSLALGSFATVRRNWRVCDFGCGGGTLLLLLARREPSLALSGIELNPNAAQCARKNLADNRLVGSIVTGDLRTPHLLPNEGFDLIVSNPPYFASGSGQNGGPARSENACSLQDLCLCANRALRSGGRFALVHRPERLVDLLATLRSCRLEPKRLRFLAHTANHPPSAVLVESVKNAHAGLAVLPVLLPGES